MKINKAAFALLLAAGLIIMTSCGGGSGAGGTGGGGVDAVTSVSATCNPTTITVSQASSCSATVKGTGHFSSTVTWSADIGSITSAGAYTAPGTPGTATIIATSTMNPNVKGQATITVNAAQQKITVTVSPQNQTIGSGATLQFTATVTNDPSNQGVTWSASAGSITSGGLFTAPNVNTQTSVTIIATSKADTTAKGISMVTVTAAIGNPTITNINPSILYLPYQGPIIGSQVNGTNFVSNDTVSFNPESGFLGATFLSASQFSASFGIDDLHYDPGFNTGTVCSGANCSNPGTFALIGNQNVIDQDPTSGEIYFLAEGPGTVWKYKSDGTSNGSFATFKGADPSISVDAATGNVVINGAIVYDPTGKVVNLILASGNGREGSGFVAGGWSCYTQPTDNNLGCGDLTVTDGFAINTTVSGFPWAIAMATISGKLQAVTFSGQSLALQHYSVPGFGLNGGLVLNGLTPEQNNAPPSGGEWQLAAFGSGPANGKAALLAQTDKILVVANLTNDTETCRVTLSGVPFRIAPDVTHGTVIVASADVASVLTRFSSVNTSTCAVTSLTSTSPLLAVGLKVSSDGSKLFVAMRDKLSVLSNK